MQARRGTALLLSCVLGLLLLAPVHAAALPQHALRGVALLAPVGVEPPHSWRSASDDAVPAHGLRAVTASFPTGAVHTAHRLSPHDIRTPAVRGPPGSALV
jgi:hypothetical protein